MRDSTGTIGAVTGRVVGVESLTELQQMFEDARVFDKGEDLTVWALRPHPTHVAAGVAGEHNFFFPYTAGQLGSGNNLALAARSCRTPGCSTNASEREPRRAAVRTST